MRLHLHWKWHSSGHTWVCTSSDSKAATVLILGVGRWRIRKIQRSTVKADTCMRFSIHFTLYQWVQPASMRVLLSLQAPSCPTDSHTSHPPIHPSICLSVHLYFIPSFHPFICQSVPPSIGPSTRPSVLPFIHLNFIFSLGQQGDRSPLPITGLSCLYVV